MTFRNLDRLLMKNGWFRDDASGSGSHVMYRKGGKKVPVPRHSGDIPKGTLNAILKQTGLK